MGAMASVNCEDHELAAQYGLPIPFALAEIDLVIQPRHDEAR